MLGPEDPVADRQQGRELITGRSRIPSLARPGGEVAPGGQGARVLRPQDPLTDRQQGCELFAGRSRIPSLARPGGEVAPGGQGEGVLESKDPLDDRQQGRELIAGRSRIPGLSRPVGAIGAGGQGLTMLGPSMTSTWTLRIFSRHRSAGMILPSRITWKTLVFGPFQRFAQARRPSGQVVNSSRVAVGGGPRDAVAAGERTRVGAIAESPRPQQRPATNTTVLSALRGAAPALGQQQPGGEPGQFPREPNRGAIGDHVGPSSGSRSCGETSSAEAPRPFPGLSCSSACLPV